MADFERRRLWSATTSLGPGSIMYESVWAYTIRYPRADHSTPGRYRIRVTKVVGADLSVLIGQQLEDSSFDFSMQAFVEKWTGEGWLSCIDWIGDPDSSVSEIEVDCNNMFKAFTTGMPIDETFIGSFPPEPRSPKPNKSKKNTQDFPDSDPPSDDSSDFDWI